MKTFINEARKSRTGDNLAILSRVAGTPLSDIEREWKEWIRIQPVDADVLLVERAFVKPYHEWRTWWNANKEKLYWSKEAQRYRPRKGYTFR